MPEAEARSYMAKLHLGDTPSNLVEENFNTVGRETEGYSGSDLAVVVREALMEPLRQCQIAQYFFKDMNGNYLPCDQNHPQKEKMTLMDVPSELLKAPPVTFEHFMTVINRGGGATVSPDELTKFEEWTKEFGQG